MLKIALISAAMLPAIVLPWLGMDSEETKFDSRTATYESAYVDPVMADLYNCESTEFDVYFHEAYIEMHSAEFISDTVKTANACANVTFSVRPVMKLAANSEDQEMLRAQTAELAAVLDAYGIKPEIKPVSTVSKTESLSLNGRTAIIEIDINSKFRS